MWGPYVGKGTVCMMIKKRSLGKTILGAMIGVVIGLVIAESIVFGLTIKNVSDTLASSNQTLSHTIGEKSSAYMSEQSKNWLLELAGEKAEIADEIFTEFERGVCIVASVAEQIYSHPELYPARTVDLPDAKNDGVLTVQVLYSSDADPNDPGIREELALIGNVQDVLMAVNASQDSMASAYVATESGFMVQADYISAKKFDDSGNLMPLEARERPWYQGAAETGKPYFTPATKDAHTPRLGIMCGVPIYAGARLMGVAGAGMYLDEMENLVQSVNLGGAGHACIINKNGQVLFSTYGEGTLAAVADAKDLRLSGDAALADLAACATAGSTGVKLLSVDGVTGYAAYAPMRTVGWSMIVFLSQEAVEAPTAQLIDSVDQMTDQGYRDAAHHIRYAVYVLLGLLALAVAIVLFVSVLLSRRIVQPIQKLTAEVGAMEGNNLNFRWDLDTGDETQLLANSFQSLTMRMKEYIREIEAFTAKNERIKTELALAARIQSNMLPGVFPPFPDKKELDLYATMDAAKEVGGDFYDFFLVDEDHLCLIMADVSGKGVPAALFMMACKIILGNYVMLGQTPGQVLETANAAVCATNKDDMFVTVWIGILVLKTGLLTAANAGHEYPVLLQPGGKWEVVRDRHGFVVGGMPDVRYREYTIQLQPGSRLFLYTDGVPEATNSAGHMFGMERMLEALNARPSSNPEDVLRSIRLAVDAFVGGEEQFDDMTRLCVEYQGSGNPERESAGRPPRPDGPNPEQTP